MSDPIISVIVDFHINCHSLLIADISLFSFLWETKPTIECERCAQAGELVHSQKPNQLHFLAALRNSLLRQFVLSTFKAKAGCNFESKKGLLWTFAFYNWTAALVWKHWMVWTLDANIFSLWPGGSDLIFKKKSFKLKQDRQIRMTREQERKWWFSSFRAPAQGRLVGGGGPVLFPLILRQFQCNASCTLVIMAVICGHLKKEIVKLMEDLS